MKEHSSHSISSLPVPRAGGPHVVQFYDGEGFLLDEVVRFLEPGIRRRSGILVIATADRRRGLEEHFTAAGVDVDGARREGWYLALDAADTLSRITLDGWPDAVRFRNVIGDALGRVGKNARHEPDARAFGEMVAILWAEGKVDAAIRLETLWNELGRERSFSLFCAYPISSFRREEDSAPFLEICAAHSQVVPAESYTQLADPEERSRIVTELQQKAQALETEARERRMIEQELKRRLDELSESDRRKDEFLAMLGHELRNPLSAVRNAIATASLDETRRFDALEIARRQADQLGRLIDDLLDVARITQGRITLRKDRVVLAEVVDRAVDSLRAFVDDRGHSLRVLARADRVRVDADAARLEQIFVNLLTNAAKYTPPGGSIDVILERDGDDAVVRVVDSGIGIAADVLPHVFDLFGQADRALDRAPGGLGIGLTLAARLAQLHGGRLTAKSEGIGKGSEFAFRIPAAPVEPEEAQAGPRLGLVRSRGVRVLMVEDNPDGAESLRMLLSLLGYHVRVASDGPTALDAAHANPPDVMLVDIGLPGMDGYEVAKRIRSDPALEDLTLVALTGYGREEDRRRAMASGFDYHLVKPVELTALQELVERVREPGPGPATAREPPRRDRSGSAGSSRNSSARRSRSG